MLGAQSCVIFIKPLGSHLVSMEGASPPAVLCWYYLFMLYLLTFWGKCCNGLYVKWHLHRTENVPSQCCGWLSCGGQDQGSAQVWRHHHLGPTCYFQVLLSHGHHLLPLWLPELLHEVWFLDLRQGQDRPGANWFKGQTDVIFATQHCGSSSAVTWEPWSELQAGSEDISLWSLHNLPTFAWVSSHSLKLCMFRPTIRVV